MTSLYSRKSISLATAGRGCLLVVVALACFALSPQARAACRQGCDISHNNTFLGDFALVNNTTGVDNTAIGGGALMSNNTGGFNTAIGFDALFSNNSAAENTATGAFALFSNTNGVSNTATGESALTANNTGSYNTANGLFALGSNTRGSSNTATGVSALGNNVSGNLNTATGYFALRYNTGGSNTANGANALLNNSSGFQNTATGVSALNKNQTGSSNTANGFDALFNNTTGSSNIALGALAGQNLTTGSNNIDIGNVGDLTDANTIRIGTPGTQTATFIAGISGTTITGTAVVVSSSGQLGVPPSSRRFKAEIKRMDKASETILALKPVTFRYKHEIDPEGIPQFGLVAEEVEKVNPDLVVRDSRGQAYTVRYEAVNAMLLNEFLKEHRKVEQLEKQVAALTAGLQKVSAQLQLNKPVPRTVLNNQ